MVANTGPALGEPLSDKMKISPEDARLVEELRTEAQEINTETEKRISTTLEKMAKNNGSANPER